MFSIAPSTNDHSVTILGRYENWKVTSESMAKQRELRTIASSINKQLDITLEVQRVTLDRGSAQAFFEFTGVSW